MYLFTYIFNTLPNTKKKLSCFYALIEKKTEKASEKYQRMEKAVSVKVLFSVPTPTRYKIYTFSDFLSFPVISITLKLYYSYFYYY